MPAFIAPVDIANRALQHCGADRILALTGDSKRAAEVSFAYDKLREAELRNGTWVFSVKRTVLRARDETTMLVTPALWSASTTYFRGCLVTDENENVWISRIPNNLNNDPLLTTFWEPYFGPLTASVYDSDLAYAAGELVYTYGGDGTNRVFMSLVDGNSDDPSAGTDWSATSTYFKDQVVTYSSVAYMSKIDLNLNNTPSASAADWSSATTYAIGNSVSGSDGYTYTSVVNSNINNDPTLDDGTHWTNTGVLTAWTSVFTGGTGSLQWLQIGGAEFPSGVTLATLNIVYPIGAGPSSQTASRNAFMLPAGFFRLVSQNPKGTTPILGGPTGYTYNDWNIENGFIISAEAGPLILRFVANVTDVRMMDPLFCEALAARIGLEVAQPITQSDGRLQTIASLYKKWMADAKLANAILAGYDDPPDDDFIAARA